MLQINKITSFLLLSILLLLVACEPKSVPQNTTQTGSDSSQVANSSVKETENAYDSVLAKRLGADDYGMRKYVLALLKSGPNKIEDKEEAQQLFAGHMANIKRLAEEGSLAVAGPFYGEGVGDMRGLYIFNVETVEEAEALTKTDPAIQAGSLVMELYPWYGSAAMVEVNNIHNKITKENIIK